MHAKNSLLLFFMILAVLSACHKPYPIIADVIPPGEVSDLQIDKRDIDVALTWNGPSDADLVGYYVAIYNADNQRLVVSQNRSADSTYCIFEKLSSGNYYVKVQTRDKENNLSDGVTEDFIYISKAPTNVFGVGVQIYWNVMHVTWDSLTSEDFVKVISGEKITLPVDSIIVDVDSGYARLALPVTATKAVIPDLPDGFHSVKVYTVGETGYQSAEFRKELLQVKFADKFVRVQGAGYDFYIARYEVTVDEYKNFVMDYGVGYRYEVDVSKVNDDDWFKWWFGKNPQYPGAMYPVGFGTYEFSWDGISWISNRYAADASFGRVTWEGGMLYCLYKYNGRLPTKDEWLYAAKGGPLSRGYDYAGSNNPDEVGWWGWVAGTPSFLQPPGLKAPNELGIYDMSGNAGEIIYDLVPSAGTLGRTQIIGGSYGPIHFWGNEGEDWGPDNSIKPKLSDANIVINTGASTDATNWRMGVRVLIPHEEIVKPPVNYHRFEP